MVNSSSTKTILVIDDEPHLCTIVKTCLETLGHWQVITAHSAQAGLDRATAQPPDAILLDIMMPDMDGHTLLQSLRDHPATQSIPTIVFTASPQHQTHRAFAQLGIAGTIAKPFNPLILADKVAELLGWRKVM